MPGKRIRVLIVDDVADTRENIRKLLLFEDDIEVAGAAADGAQAVEAAKQLKPDVILMDINMPGMDGIAAAEAISVQVPQSQVIMMSVQGEADYLRRSMLAGAREFLIKPFTGDELVEGIRRVYELGAVRREMAPAVTPAAAAQPRTPAVTVQEGKVIAVFSPKGGTGRTTVSANLAIALKTSTNKRVALVDCSLQFGDIAVMLNMEAKKNIADLVSSTGELDDELLEDVLQNHSSGIRVLLAPPRPEMAELVTTAFLKGVLQRLRASHDYVVVDTWTSFHDEILAVLDLADRIVVLMTSDVPTVKNVKVFLEIADALGYPHDKTVLVLNRADGRAGISTQDIQRTINHPIAATIANDAPLVTAAMNRGVPLVLAQKDSQVARNIHEVARYLVAGFDKGKPAAGAQAAAQPAKKGLFGRLLG